MANPSDNKNIFDKFDVNFSKKYGEGGYGATFAAADKATGEALAVKVIDMRKMRPEAIRKECQILENLTHPNVIHQKGHGPGPTNTKYASFYFIFMELASGGELFDQVIDRGANAMPEPVARGFFCQLLDGVAYLHAAGVAHRDLKLENVLLTSTGEVKLIDFGLSHVYQRLADGTPDRSPLTHRCGTPAYAAPELLFGRCYDGMQADIWSLGVCLFAMVLRQFPLPTPAPQLRNDRRAWDQVKEVVGKMARVQQQGTSVLQFVYGPSASKLSDEASALLDGLLRVDPRKRLSAVEAHKHAWVVGPKLEAVDPQQMGVDDPTPALPPLSATQATTPRAVTRSLARPVASTPSFRSLASPTTAQTNTPPSSFRSLASVPGATTNWYTPPRAERQMAHFNLLVSELMFGGEDLQDLN